jgi:lipopolysaccharide/colanic/teichoic acid biosynthesis glycosyltransferase
MREGAEREQEALTRLNEADGPLFKIKEDPRRTRLGVFLRRTSLDELPQFYNVLKGEMSLIGPRPALPSEVEQYQPWQRRRLETWPGLTGLWQVSGRSDRTFDEMVLLDIYYIENWSPLLDLKIALKTIPTLILGTGAY